MDNEVQKNGNGKVMASIAGLIIVLIGGFLYMRSRGAVDVQKSPSEMSATGDMMLEEASDSANNDAQTDVVMSQDVQTVTLEAGSFYYKPNTIKAKVGQQIKIVMTSKDMMHDFVIDELNVKLPIVKSGETNEVVFTASKAGSFEFYCSVGKHRAQGQVGTLIVE